MSEAVLTALVGAGQAITLGLIGLIGIRLGKVKKDAAAAREQVENNHRNPDGTVINMREENDSRHAETKRWVDDLAHSMSGQRPFATSVKVVVVVLYCNGAN